MGMRDRAVRRGAALVERLPAPIRRSYRLRRAGHRFAHGTAVESVPERPIGAKLELTYHCNLRCSFCYTDSPRRTVARTAEMSDENWRRIVDDAVGLGVIEVVLTGGEPLLRPELTVWAAQRFSEAGAMVTLNTNGWFMTPEIADELADAGVRLHISLDGASPELHDSSRGVPGSWRRAVAAADMGIERGCKVQIVHVVTPQNEGTIGEFLDQMRVLGPNSLRVVPVGRIGAASRGEWDVDWPGIRAEIDRRVRAPRPRVLPGSEVQGVLIAADRAPQSFLVRPNGAFLADSQHPFSFGHAAEESLADCWAHVRTAWRDDKLESWRREARSPGHAAKRDLVPYRDEEEVVAGLAPGAAEARKTGAELDRALEVLNSKTPAPPSDGRGDIAGATELIRGLALDREYRWERVRWSGDAAGRRLVRVRSTGKVHALNATAGAVMDALDGGTMRDAIASLAAQADGADEVDVERDALNAIATLLEAGIAAPARSQAVETPGADEGTFTGLPG